MQAIAWILLVTFSEIYIEKNGTKIPFNFIIVPPEMKAYKVGTEERLILKRVTLKRKQVLYIWTVGKPAFRSCEKSGRPHHS